MTRNYPLKHDELPPEIMSEYVARGVCEERLRIKDVVFDLEGMSARALVDVETDFRNSYEAGDNSYHWSSITAYRAISQLAVGYICTELGMSKKEIGEIMQTGSRMNTDAPILQKDNVPLRIRFSKYIKRGRRVLGEVLFDVADGTFHGDIRFSISLD